MNISIFVLKEKNLSLAMLLIDIFLWVYFNIDDNVNTEDELRTLTNPAKENKLKNKG